MDKYAVVKFGGKQLMVTEGQKFEIERQKSLDMDVLLFSDNGNVQVGTPVLEDVTVKAKVLEEKKSKKVTVARYKSKSRYRRKKGHRQPLSVIQIESIGKAGTKAKNTKNEKTEAKTDSKVESKTKTSPKKASQPKSTKKVTKKKEEKK